MHQVIPRPFYWMERSLSSGSHTEALQTYSFPDPTRLLICPTSYLAYTNLMLRRILCFINLLMQALHRSYFQFKLFFSNSPYLPILTFLKEIWSDVFLKHQVFPTIYNIYLKSTWVLFPSQNKQTCGKEATNPIMEEK